MRSDEHVERIGPAEHHDGRKMVMSLITIYLRNRLKLTAQTA